MSKPTPRLYPTDQSFLDALEANGHVLQTHEDGINMSAMAWDIHNGPVCIKCRDSWCIHCMMRHQTKIEPCNP